MGDIVAIGAQPELAGLALAGAQVVTAEGEARVLEAWETRGRSAQVVVLTRSARAALGDRISEVSPDAPLVVVLP